MTRSNLCTKRYTKAKKLRNTTVLTFKANGGQQLQRAYARDATFSLTVHLASKNESVERDCIFVAIVITNGIDRDDVIACRVRRA